MKQSRVRVRKGRAGTRFGAAFAGALLILGVVAPPANAATVSSIPRGTKATAGPATGEVALVWKAPFKSGGTPITDYGFDRSVDGGVSWSVTTWFGSTALSASSTTAPALACPNAGAGSDGKGCWYRLRAKNAIGVSSPGKTVKTWTVPSKPRKVVMSPDAALASVAITWNAPAKTGGFPSVSYVIQRSDDGGAYTTVATTTARSATVPCTGALSCRYSVAAVNGQGTGPWALTGTIVTKPGRAQSFEVRNLLTHLGTGISDLSVSWYPPTTGLPPVSFLYETCRVAPGAKTGCEETSAAWSSPESIVASAGLHTRAATCTDNDASCYFRVAAVNDRGGVGAWRTLDLRPWAPFGVGVTPGPNAGEVTITFGGPTESGYPGAPKYYRAFVCTADCGNDTNWSDTGLSIAYPPSGSSPSVAGTYACGQAAACQVRMQFVDGRGEAGPVSAPASAPGLTLSVTTPVDGSAIIDRTPEVTGLCTTGLGTVTATVLPGPVTLTAACSPTGTWSAVVPADLADGPYTVSATQDGTVPGTVSNTNTFTIDNTPPEVTITSPTNGANYSSNAVILTGSCSENGRPVTVAITGSTTATLTATCTSGAWTAAVSLPTGSYSAVASQTDVLGNTGTSATVPFSVNASTPAVDTTSPADGALLTTSQPPFSGVCTTAAGPVTVAITGPTPVTTSTACAAGAWSLSPAPVLADGLYSVVASQTVAGTTFTHTPHGFRIDTVAPVTTDNAVSFGPAWRNSPATVTLSPSDPSPGSGVAATYYTVNGTTPTTASPSGTSVALTADGVYTIKYFSVDVAGNVEAVKTASVQVRVDRTAPTVAIAFPVNGRDYNATRCAAGCPVTGICGSGGDALSGLTGVAVQVKRLSDARYWNGSTWVTTATSLPATGTASWSLPLAASALTDGVQYAVSATASDAAGNTATATSTFTYDTTGPQVTSVTASNGNWALTSGDTFTVIFNDAIDPASLPSTATLTLRNNGGDCNNVVTSYQISGLTAGEATTGSCGYLKGTGNALRTVTWDGTITVTGNVVVFTVTTGCIEAGCSASLSTAAPNANRQQALSFTPAPTIADTAGNAVVTSTTSYCRNGVVPCGAPW